MNKYMTFALLLFFLTLVTYIVDVTQVYTVTNGIDGQLSSPTEFTTGGIGSLLGTFWDLMLLNVEGLPTIVNLLIFHPLAGMALYMGLDIGKDLIPFT